MDVVIDESWYQRPAGIGDRTSSGGVVCRLEQDEVLLALVREKDGHRLVLPKGGVNPGERLEVASRREVQEEAGFTDLVMLMKLGTCERLSLGKQVWVTTHFYLYVTRQTTAVPTDPEHAYAPIWVAIKQLQSLFWPEQRRLIETHRQTIIARVRDHSAT